MGHIEQYEKGDVARFKAVFKDSQGDAIEPDFTNGDHDVSIEITQTATEDILVSTTDMKELSNTEFEYRWQTTEGMSRGEYEVEVRGKFEGDDALNRDRVKLTDIFLVNQGQ